LQEIIILLVIRMQDDLFQHSNCQKGFFVFHIEGTQTELCLSNVSNSAAGEIFFKDLNGLFLLFVFL